jgi:hypothetical protein
MRRRLVFTGIVVALAIGAAACGGGSGSEGAVSIKTLQAAVSNTQATESSRFTMTIRTELSGESVDLEATGVASGDGKELQMTLTLPAAGSLEERLVDGTIYMDFGGLAAGRELPEGKQWVSVSLDELQSRTGTDFSQLLDQAETSGPTQGLQYLQGLSGDVEKIGDDTVGGEHATHYRASIDYAKVAAKLPSTSTDLAEKLAKLGTVPADVWIDDQDRIVKMHFTIDGSALGAGAGTADFTMEFTGFGVPVDVQAPPADETVDLLTLQGQPA